MHFVVMHSLSVLYQVAFKTIVIFLFFLTIFLVPFKTFLVFF